MSMWSTDQCHHRTATRPNVRCHGVELKLAWLFSTWLMTVVVACQVPNGNVACTLLRCLILAVALVWENQVWWLRALTRVTLSDLQHVRIAAAFHWPVLWSSCSMMAKCWHRVDSVWCSIVWSCIASTSSRGKHNAHIVCHEYTWGSHRVSSGH